MSPIWTQRSHGACIWCSLEIMYINNENRVLYIAYVINSCCCLPATIKTLLLQTPAPQRQLRLSIVCQIEPFDCGTPKYIYVSKLFCAFMLF